MTEPGNPWRRFGPIRYRRRSEPPESLQRLSKAQDELKATFWREVQQSWFGRCVDRMERRFKRKPPPPSFPQETPQ